MIRAGIPVCVACFAFCLERKVPTEIGMSYLLLVTLSVMCVMFTGDARKATRREHARCRPTPDRLCTAADASARAHAARRRRPARRPRPPAQRVVQRGGRTGKEHGEALGIGMCTVSVIMQSAQMSLAGKLMSGKLDSFQLTFYTGPPQPAA